MIVICIILFSSINISLQDYISNWIILKYFSLDYLFPPFLSRVPLTHLLKGRYSSEVRLSAVGLQTYRITSFSTVPTAPLPVRSAKKSSEPQKIRIKYTSNCKADRIFFIFIDWDPQWIISDNNLKSGLIFTIYLLCPTLFLSIFYQHNSFSYRFLEFS